jgi:16S rRNA (guanine527-N7)-methyltransferase
MLAASPLFHVKHDQGLPEAIVSRETTERLEAFVNVLRHWAETLNLVAPRDLAVLWERHVRDSLQLLPLVPTTGACIDFGSGAGFPGLVLAIATGQSFHLVESDQRKAAFLREGARAAGATVVVHAERIERAALPKAALITARAVAPLNRLLVWGAPLLLPSGACLFPKGRNVDAELTQAATEWHMKVKRWQSGTDPDAAILQITEVSRIAGLNN